MTMCATIYMRLCVVHVRMFWTFFSFLFFRRKSLTILQGRQSNTGTTREQRPRRRRHGDILFFSCQHPSSPFDFVVEFFFCVFRSSLGSTRNKFFRINILFTGHRSSSLRILYSMGCCVECLYTRSQLHILQQTHEHVFFFFFLCVLLTLVFSSLPYSFFFNSCTHSSFRMVALADASYFRSTFFAYTIIVQFSDNVCSWRVCGSRVATVVCCFWWNINVRVVVYFIHRASTAHTYPFLSAWPFRLVLFFFSASACYWWPSLLLPFRQKMRFFFFRRSANHRRIRRRRQRFAQSVFLHARNQTNDEKWEQKRRPHKRRWKL